MRHEVDPIVGVWDFRNGNICTFNEGGDIHLCGQRIAIWKHIERRNYVHVYLRGFFSGASDSLVVGRDSQTMQAFVSGNKTITAHRVENSSFTPPDGCHAIVGAWDFNDTNICHFTLDGWIEVCGWRVGLWMQESDEHYLAAYFRGFFGGESGPFVLSEDGQSIDALISDSTTRKLLRIANDASGE